MWQNEPVKSLDALELVGLSYVLGFMGKNFKLAEDQRLFSITNTFYARSFEVLFSLAEVVSHTKKVGKLTSKKKF